MQELMAVVPLVEVQSSRTQRPTAGTSYPYVDLTLGDMNTQRVIQLQLEQVLRKHTQGHSSEATHDHFQWSCYVSVLTSAVFVHRVWSCVESSPCRWKTWCLCGRRDSPCHPAKSPCYNTCLIVHTHLCEHTYIRQNLYRLPLPAFRCLLCDAHTN